MKKDKSAEWFEQAQRVIPGGVNSPVRAFRAVGGEPRFIARGAGSRIFDVDGNGYIDYVGSWGPLILGHCHPEVMEVLAAVLRTGTSFGAPTPGEVELARMVREAFPSMEKVRLTSSGTEATMSAIRVARAFTTRKTILKFEGCYHGHADALLAKAGSGVATFGLPDSAGIPAEFTQYTLTVPFNDIAAIEEAFARRKGEIAAVIVEPVVGNMGCVLPRPGFLEALRRLAKADGALLIFDEVITGFRIAYGGAQERFAIRADMTTLGKVIGGGLPIGAFGGRAEIMDMVAPVGPVYQAGTLSGNPLAVEAGRKTLEILRRPRTYEQLEESSAKLTQELTAAAQAAGVAARINRLGSMFTVFFTEQEVSNYASAKCADTARYAAFFRAMLESGVYLPPSQFEAAFVSLAHTAEDLEQTATAARAAFAELKR